jgi:hypothetical protein
LPAAIIAMAIRGGFGEDFELVFFAFAMLSQYTANSSREMESRASPPGRPALDGRDARRSTNQARPSLHKSSPRLLPVRRLRHQRHQIVRHPVGGMPRHRAFLQIISQHRAHPQRLDRFQIDRDLRSSL